MESCYPLFCKGETVGSVTLEKAGLFLRLICSGRVPDTERYRLILYSKKARTDLGLFYSLSEGIVVRIPLRQAGEPPYRFCLESADARQFVAVFADKSFDAISKLIDARFAVCNGQPGVFIKDQFQGRLDNGQNLGSLNK